MIKGNNPRCVEGSKRSLAEIEEQREIDASNAADDFAARSERMAELAWDCEIEW